MTVDMDRDVAGTLKVLGEPVRLRIVELLAREELCVCHLVDELALPQPLISHHLRTLRTAGLVEAEKWRYWTYYRLQPAVLAAVAERLRSLSSPRRGRKPLRPCC